MYKLVRPLALTATLLLVTSVAQAQSPVAAPYTTDFGVASTSGPPSTPGTAATDGYTYQNNALTAGQTLVGPSSATTTGTGTGQNSWMTNDPERLFANGDSVVATNGAFVGGSNTVRSQGAFFPGGAAATIGGTYRNEAFDVVPGAASSYLYKPITLSPGTGQGYQLSVDNFVVASSGTTLQRDTFGYTFRNSTGSNLFQVTFTPTTRVDAVSGNTVQTATIGYRVGSSTTSVTNNNGIDLNSQFNLNVKVNPLNGTFSIAYTQGGVTLTPFSNISLNTTDATVINGVTQIAATWILADNSVADANGGFTTAGSNALYFDNYTVNYYTAVPEPSTYVVIGLGLFLGLQAFKRVKSS